MGIGRDVLKRGTDAVCRSMLLHKEMEALHLPLCIGFDLNGNNLSTDDSKVVYLTLRSLIRILPIEHFGLDKTVVSLEKLQSDKHLRCGSLVDKIHFGRQQDIFSRQSKKCLHQSQVEKEIFDVFLVFLCTQWDAIGGSMLDRSDEACQCQQPETFLDRCGRDFPTGLWFADLCQSSSCRSIFLL